MSSTHSTPSGRSPRPSGGAADQEAHGVPVLYRSAGDGWRVGLAESTPNATCVVVVDVRTGLRETVRQTDTVDPRSRSVDRHGRTIDTSGLSDEALCALLSSAESPDCISKAIGSPLAAAANAALPTLNDDLARLNPSPLLFEGTIVDALRCRYRHGRQVLHSGAADESAAVTTFAGDNVAYTIRPVPPSGISVAPRAPSEVPPMPSQAEGQSHTAVAERMYAALQSTRCPQTLLAASATSGYGEVTNAAVHLTQLMSRQPSSTTPPNGSPSAVPASVRLSAALAVLQSFTHDINGVQHALTHVALLGRPDDGHSFAGATVGVQLFDVDRLATAFDANTEILGFMAHALSSEERERCYLPTKRTAKPPVCVGTPPQATIDRLGQRYFIFCEALETLRFEVHLQLFVFARIAAVVHLLEVSFTEAGEPINLASMRNACKLISADFNSMSALLTSRQMCVAAAKLLFMSTMRFLTSKLNARLNEAGAQDGEGGVRADIVLASGFAPGTISGPSSASEGLHALYRNVFFEEVCQRFFVTTDAELSQWQAQGFVVPKQLQAALNPFDNYNAVRLLKAKGGVLHTVDQALATLFKDLNQSPASTKDSPRPDPVSNASTGNTAVDDATAKKPAKPLPTHWTPTPTLAARLRYASIPAGKETESDRPPKSALKPVEIPVKNDNLAMMAFIYACEVRPSSAVSGTMITADTDYMLALGNGGNMTMWRNAQPVWTGKAPSELVSLHVADAFHMTLQILPQGPKSKPVDLSLRCFIRTAPNDVDAHRDQMSQLVSAVLHLDPKAKVTYDDVQEEQEAEEDPTPVRETPMSAAPLEDAAATAAANEATDRVRRGFSKLAKHPKCKYDAKMHQLTVQHSFGLRTYVLPPLDAARLPSATALAEVGSWLTTHAPPFDDLRAHLVADTDDETQEALVTEEQTHYHPTLSALFRADVDSLVSNVLTRPQARFWFNFVVLTGERGFNGPEVEAGLNTCLIQPVLTLRLQLAHHYLPVEPSFVVQRFLGLLPGPKRMAFRAADHTPMRDHVYAEEVCLAADVPCVIGKDCLLISAAGLCDLDRAMGKTHDRSATTVQQFVRAVSASAIVSRRLNTISQVVAQDDAERQSIIALRQWQLDNATQHRLRRIALQEEEFAVRRAIADECWVAWVAKQAEVQQKIDALVQNAVAERIRLQKLEERRSHTAAQRQAVDALTQRIQQRVMQQGVSLDEVVRKKLASGAQTQKRMEKLRETHERLFRQRAAEEERRRAQEALVEKKSRRTEVVHQRVEKHREHLREELWQRQEHERQVRERIEANRAVLEQQAQEELAMDRVSAQLRRRAESELLERQRAQRQALQHEYESEKQRKERAMEAQAKRQWAAKVRKEKAEAAERAAEAERRRRQQNATWHAQEKVRQAAEKAKREDEARQKTLTRKLLKAQTVLYTPTLFEQSSGGGDARLVQGVSDDRSTSRARSAKGRAKSAPRSSSAAVAQDMEGFHMSTGRTTYQRLLPEKVWDGLIRHHERQLGQPSSASASFSNLSRKSTQERLFQQASPRSVTSL